MADSSHLAAEGQFWHHSNITLTQKEYMERTVAYRIEHVASGKVFIGWLGDAWRGLQLVAGRLHAGNFPNQELQALVSEDHRCNLEVFRPSYLLAQADQQEVMREVMENWIAAAGELYIPATTALPPRKAEVQEPVVRKRRVGHAKPQPLKEPSAQPRPPRKPRQQVSSNSLSPWRNMVVSSKEHRGVGVFELYHPHTGVTFLGSTKNVFDALSVLSAKVRHRLCSNQRFQQAFDAQPVFTLQIQMIQQLQLSIPDRVVKANLQLFERLHELGELGEIVLQGRQRADNTAKPAETVQGGRKYPHGGEMHQTTTQARDGALLPARDFLHCAWFGV